jgi:rRNA maturation endonuclease Nob1
MNNDKYIEEITPIIIETLKNAVGASFEDEHRALVVLEHNIKKVVENLTIPNDMPLVCLACNGTIFKELPRWKCTTCGDLRY